MNASTPLPAWEAVATIELDDSAASFADLQALAPSYIRVDECVRSPPGCRWVQVMALTTDVAGSNFVADVLAALQLSSHYFRTFRIIDGSYWLEHAADGHDHA